MSRSAYDDAINVDFGCFFVVVPQKRGFLKI